MRGVNERILECSHKKNAARKEEQDEEAEVFFFHHCLTWLGVILKLE